MRYSAVHFVMGISLIFISSNLHILIATALTLNAILSHLHLWPAVNATLKKKFGKWRIRFIFYGLSVVWLMPVIFYVFPEYHQSIGRAGTVYLMVFLGPPITMFEIYTKLEKGKNDE